MTSTLHNPPLSKDLRWLLRRVRWRIRWYVCLEGLLLVLVWLGLTFWVGLALDYLPVLAGASEMPRVARAVLLALIAGVMAWILYRWVLRRTFVRLRDSSMALLVERHFGQFHDSLVTAVELSDRPHQAAFYDPAMLAHTHEDAMASAGQVRLGRIFNYRPLLKKLLLACLLLLPVGALYAADRDAWQLGISRLYLLHDQPWPRRAHIEVLGIEVEEETATAGQVLRRVSFEERQVKVARGSSVHLRARAAADDHVVPEVCTVYYRTDQQERGRVQMSRIGRVRDGYQLFAFDGKPFRGILTSLQFDIVGFDHRVRDYRIEVVDNPTVVETKLDCIFPDYLVDQELGLWLPREDVPWTPGMQLPQGTQLTIRARSNKPLREVLVRYVARDERTVAEISPGNNAHQFEFRVPRLEDDLSLEIVLHDTDDVISQRPHRVFVAAIDDQAPQVDVVLQGVREAITPQALVPLTGTIADDYQTDRSWFEVQVNEGQPYELPLALQPGGSVAASLDFRELNVVQEKVPFKPKDRLSLTVRAADKHDLAGGANIGSGDTYQLEVVTPEELLMLLEKRELALRQRFEVIITEMQQMRDLLLDLSDAEQEPALGAEPGDETLDEETLAARTASLRLLRAQQAALQSQKSSQEILGVAESFDEIRQELINNRVDSSDKQERLQNQVSEPLKKISLTMFPELDRQLEQLQELAEEQKETATAAEQAVAEANDILAELEKVLERMIELESYNELIGLVRSLIEEQEQVMERTKEEQKRQILDLLK